MRHSFLPNTEQKKLKREYHIHLLIVALFFLCGAGLIGSASLFPAYIAANVEAREQSGTMDSLKKDNDQNGVAVLENELQLHAARMAALSSGSTVSSSVLIQNIISLRGQVRIQAISIQSMSTSTAEIKIEGIAPTRDSLVAFKSSLEKAQQGTKVDLPISEFAQSKDISFSLDIIQPLQ